MKVVKRGRGRAHGGNWPSNEGRDSTDREGRKEEKANGHEG